MNSKRLEPGKAALDGGDYSAAIEEFTALLQEDASYIPAYIMLARSYNLVGRHEYAIGVILHGTQAYVELLDADPDRASLEFDELDESLAESIVYCAKAQAEAGYNSPLPEQLTTGVEYYLANFKNHLSGVASIEAALAHKAPILYEYNSRLNRG